MVLAPDSFPFLVIGNKEDLDETGQRVVSTEQAKKYVKDRLGENIKHIEASARDNTNVSEAFESIARDALER